MSKTFYHKVSDKQWEIIEPHLPKAKTTGRPALDSRVVFDAIFWVLDSGAKWRYLPEKFGNWNSIYHKFRKWCDEGVFEKILRSLLENSRKYFLAEIDSTFCKVHQHAAGARKIFGNQDIGTSRGGKTTKIHALVNEHFQLIGVELSGGNVHDSEIAIKLLSKVALNGKTVLADKAFCSEEIRKFIAQEKLMPAFPTNQMPSSYTILMKNFTKQEILSKDFFNALKTFDIFPHDMTNCPIAF